MILSTCNSKIPRIYHRKRQVKSQIDQNILYLLKFSVEKHHHDLYSFKVSQSRKIVFREVVRIDKLTRTDLGVVRHLTISAEITSSKSCKSNLEIKAEQRKVFFSFFFYCKLSLCDTKLRDDDLLLNTTCDLEAAP